MDQEYSTKIAKVLAELNDFIDVHDSSKCAEQERAEALKDLIKELNQVTTVEKQLFDL